MITAESMVEKLAGTGAELGGKPVPVLDHFTADHVPLRACRGNILYRFYGYDGRLMYIGITTNLKARCNDHETRDWWPNVAFVTVQRRFTGRPHLENEEKKAIGGEDPIYNLLEQQVPMTTNTGRPSMSLKVSSPKVYEMVSTLLNMSARHPIKPYPMSWRPRRIGNTAHMGVTWSAQQ